MRKIGTRLTRHNVRIFIIAMILIGLPMNGMAQTTNKNMDKKGKTIRLIYPQWQGGHIADFIPEVKDTTAASQGYTLGARLLDFLAPAQDGETFTVPVSMSAERKLQDGVYDRDAIASQTHAAMEILTKANPDRIVTFGGECSVSAVPFTYLAKKYDGDVAMVWIDAHPDITLPGEVYPAYHAMAVTACMGMGDKKILSELPTKIPSDKIIYIGLRDWERDEIKSRQQQLGIKNLTVADVRNNSDALLAWIKQTGAKHILVHFDMDVLDPAEIIPAVGVVKDGMKIDEVVRVINDIAHHNNIVALTVAEPMPRTAILLQNMLKRLPMIASAAKTETKEERNKR